MSFFNATSEHKKKISLFHFGIILFSILSAIMIITGVFGSSQAKNPSMPKITFIGEYKIADGEWFPVQEGQHIPANKGDVTLKGYFRIDELESDDPEKKLPADTTVSFYANHVTISVHEPGQDEPFVLDAEHDFFGEDSCGQIWRDYTPIGTTEENIQIVIRNPHRFGNATAVDDFLDSLYVYSVPYFEQMALDFGQLDRAIGLFALIVSFIILGVTAFASILRTLYRTELKLIGLMVLFGSIYFLFSAEAVYYWCNLVIFNTMAKGIAAMLYMISAFCIITHFLSGKSKKIATYATTASVGICIICILIPLLSDVFFYDMLFFWAIGTVMTGIVLLGCVLSQCKHLHTTLKMIRILSAMILLSFFLDVIATGAGWWQGGFLSKNTFILTFVMEIVIVLQIIPKNINASEKAKELEAEKNALDLQLAESRISTMISQIRPHFIYNTLGSIEQLCEMDPPKAAELVHNFAKYLRGNFGELDNPRPIRMSQEMEHVKHYISIEKVRFPDMEFTFEMNSGDFNLPALTVQPIIENAIKHGLMKLPKGGSIHVTSYETDTHYHIKVVDDGVGFDTGILLDERKHIGLRNIRGRLEAMVNGTLEIESTIGAGTEVTITIPKEVSQ